jgi:hypothetical protein
MVYLFLFEFPSPSNRQAEPGYEMPPANHVLAGNLVRPRCDSYHPLRAFITAWQ